MCDLLGNLCSKGNIKDINMDNISKKCVDKLKDEEKVKNIIIQKKKKVSGVHHVPAAKTKGAESCVKPGGPAY